MYTRLPPEPQRKEALVELFPDTQEEGVKSGINNYLDEFLSAIKIFGYLERPVFHELTRTMQTRKLIAGETLNLEEEKGFCLVVDGLVEIFVKSNATDRSTESDVSFLDTEGDGLSDSDSDRGFEGGRQGYQLLTEVRNGAPMSSMFSILSLFTEDVKLRHADDDGHSARASGSHGAPATEIPPSVPQSPDYLTAKTLNPSQGTAESPPESPFASIPAMTLDPPHPSSGSSERPKPRRMKTNSVHPDIISRAKVDTTIAIIPASAFRRLTRIYPKATSHIVQVILTRLQRVTLSTAHSYLGLTSEVLRTEKHMNKYTSYELPNFLRGTALDRLKEKFSREKERIGPEDSRKGIALHNAAVGRRRRSSTSLRKEATMQSLASRKHGDLPRTDHAPGDSSVSPSPGDLLTNIHISRSGGRQVHPVMQPGSLMEQSTPEPASWNHDTTSPLTQRTFNPFAPRPLQPQLHRQESVDEDALFRGSILECIFKAIGLTSTQNALRMADSVEASPYLGGQDQRKTRNGSISNAFGFIDPYEGSADGDTESVTSSSVSNFGAATSQNIISEMKDEVEIVFFPKGSVLVEQGERNPGLYYVIDGFLDVGVPSDTAGNVDSTSQRPSVVSRKSSHYMTPRNASLGVRHGGGLKAKKQKNSHRKSISLIKPGGIAGYIGTISSYRSFIDVTAKTDVYVGFLPRSALERIVEKYPIVLLTMVKRLTSLLPRLILHIDFALEWVQVDAGQVVYHQGDESDAIYIVLNGRLRSVLNSNGSQAEVVGEYGQGESVGELEVMTETPRPATLHAIRDTELAKFPKTLFNSLAQEHPGITIQISKIIASRMRTLIEDPVFLSKTDKTTAATNTKVSSVLNLRTVAIVPVTAGVPVVEFGSRLVNALTQIGAPNGVTSLNQAAILNHLGRHAFSRMGKLKLSQYLADLEEKYGLVLYIAGMFHS
jgi:lysophospholipid hydrolase